MTNPSTKRTPVRKATRRRYVSAAPVLQAVQQIPAAFRRGHHDPLAVALAEAGRQARENGLTLAAMGAELAASNGERRG